MTPVDRRVAVGSILFTDLVGFTEYTDALGDVAAVAVLDRQREIVDAELEHHDDARLVKEIGDGLMIWTGSAVTGFDLSVALLRAFDAARADGRFPLGVRMGLHHGESIARGDDVVGQTVNIAARVAALAGPGELLVSEEVTDACADAERSVRLSPVGPVVVRGVQSPIWLHRVAGF